MAAGGPEEVGFRTKPQLARVMLERALDAGVSVAWVTTDEVDGGDPALRGWLAARGLSYVLGRKGLRTAGDGHPGSARATAAQVAASVPPEEWVACSAATVPRERWLDDWARI